MKYVKLLLGLQVVVLFAALSGVTMTSCTKQNTDTIYVPHDSAVYVHDTTTRIDTTYSLNSGLVAYYNFNGGNLNDSSGYNNNITFNNATPTSDRNGVANNAYLFDGSGSYMAIPNSPSLNPDNITMFAIVKVNGFYQGTDHANFILQKDCEQCSGEYQLQFNDNNVNPTAPPDSVHEVFSGAYGDKSLSTEAAYVNGTGVFITAGTWYKLAYTYDGMVANLYLNGNLLASTPWTVPFTPDTADLYIGREIDPSNLFPFWFNGVIDEIRIYNRALTGKEVASLTNLP